MGTRQPRKALDQRCWAGTGYRKLDLKFTIPRKYEQVFQEGLGKLEGFEATLDIDPNATPRFHKARALPYSMRAKVEQEFDRLIAEGTLQPVDHSDWVAPIVAMLKESVRVSG